MLFENGDVAHSPQCHACYGGAFLGCGDVVEFTLPFGILKVCYLHACKSRPMLILDV